MKRTDPLKVFLTIDTELWPASPDWPVRALPSDKRDFHDELAADVHGLTTAGGYGLPYQIGVLNRHRLKATYFVEALFAGHAGLPALSHIVRLVQGGGHEVQLHLHTEWLRELNDPRLPAQYCQFMCQLPQAQQSALIRAGLEHLTAAGVPQVHAFRAGSYGGNLATLAALAENGIFIDSSYNRAYLNGDWGGAHWQHPQRINGVWEFPVAGFHDFPGHFRHAQLCACSFHEMKNALLAAWHAGWPAYVIVLHSFELVKKHGHRRLPTPDRLNIRRFEQLCAFLGAQGDKFQTTWFSEAARHDWPHPAAAAPPRSRLFDTLWRVGEQAWSRIR